jgi:beta-1,4-mannosyltransferase
MDRLVEDAQCNEVKQPMRKRSLRVVQVSKVRMNPYVGLLQDSLRRAGVACITADGLSPRLVQSWVGTTDVVHVHWVELLYASSTLVGSLRRWVTVLAGLIWARLQGIGLVCTMHNANPHERVLPLLDRVANHTLMSLAAAVHVHDEEARQTLARVYGRRTGVYVIPHGSYMGVYPDCCTQAQAREHLGLKQDAFVYLCLGQIRRYKGIEDLIAAFRRLPDENAYLVIAGNAHDACYGRELSMLARGDTRIVTWFQYVKDVDIQYFMRASNVCVLPYRDVTTSGAAILAFSFGRPIVVPAVGGFAALAENGRGILYDPASPDGLWHALQQARTDDMDAAAAQALAWARQHEWSSMAPFFVHMYADVLASKPVSGKVEYPEL